MAVSSLSTPPPAEKAPTTFAHTRISSLFSNLIVAVTRYIEAERDVEHVDVWHPAFSDWLAAAESALERVKTLIAAIGGADLMRTADRPLALMALLLDGMLGAETADGFLHFHRLLEEHTTSFRVRGTDVVAYRINQMLLSLQHLIEDLATLDCITGEDGLEISGDDIDDALAACA